MAKLKILIPFLGLLCLFGAPPARADAGYAPPPPPPPQNKPAPGQTDQPGETPGQLTPRQHAEQLYAEAYESVQEGKEALRDGKEKSAAKKFGKALEKSQDAVKLDSTYYQAWNLVAYCSRKTGKLADAFPAYARCLKLKPDYEVAHEYLGEAYLMADSVERAHEQLTWLRKKSSDYAEELKLAIARYDQAHATAAAPADSAKKQ